MKLLAKFVVDEVPGLTGLHSSFLVCQVFLQLGGFPLHSVETFLLLCELLLQMLAAYICLLGLSLSRCLHTQLTALSGT